MLLIPERAGPSDPRPGSPSRRTGSARRTTSIDTSRPHGPKENSIVDARARDLVTDRTGGVASRSEQSIRAEIAPTRELIAIESDPFEPQLAELLGLYVGPGFRARMSDILPDHVAGQTLLHALLDDLPGATLVSGYAVQRSRGLTASPDKPSAQAYERHVHASEDMCAGWARDATIMVTFRREGSSPVAMGPEAPLLEREGDALSWHAMADLPPEATRRRRRLDLLPPGDTTAAWAFDSHFRDSYRDAEGTESIIHEYVVDGTLDRTATHIDELRTEARVLPWVECPAAVGSSARMASKPLARLRFDVRNEFVGTTTCTHLNDAFRFLSDLIPLHALVSEVQLPTP
jgi:Protein of unknown function (DUF2889)